MAEPIARYGEPDGPLAFGYVGDAAIRSDGILAVVDLLAPCSIVLISRPEGTVWNRFGRCGQGPGEFRRIRSIATWGERLFVHDEGRGDITVLDREGNELSRVAIGSKRGVFAVAHIDIVDDSTAVVALEGVENADVARLDLRTGAFLDNLMDQPDLADEGARRTLRRMASCVHDSAPGSTAVVMNTWAFEAVGIRLADGTRSFRYITSVPLTPQQRADGSWHTGNYRTFVGCGRSGVLFGMVEALPRSPRTGLGSRLGTETTPAVFVEMRSYDGRLLLRRAIRNRSDPLYGWIVGMVGDTAFVASYDEDGLYPVVNEVHVTPRP